MEIPDIALIMNMPSHLVSRSAEHVDQTIGHEFDALLLGLLLRSGEVQSSDAETDSTGTQIWNDFFTYSLARELAGSGALSFSKSLTERSFSQGGGSHAR